MQVRVNGVVVQDPLVWVDVNSDEITVSGQRCASSEEAVWILHKPRGYLTSRTCGIFVSPCVLHAFVCARACMYVRMYVGGEILCLLYACK
jgi:hypothetical protein